MKFTIVLWVFGKNGRKRGFTRMEGRVNQASEFVERSWVRVRFGGWEVGFYGCSAASVYNIKKKFQANVKGIRLPKSRSLLLPGL